jgi:hypothetical protein
VRITYLSFQEKKIKCIKFNDRSSKQNISFQERRATMIKTNDRVSEAEIYHFSEEEQSESNSRKVLRNRNLLLNERRTKRMKLNEKS